MKPDSKVSEKIVDRTIFLMGKKGSADLTVRDIATAAGVNSAAVNYYFDSKEQLFEVVQGRFSSAFGEVVAQLQDTKTPPEQLLLTWVDEIMRYLIEYPGVLNLVTRLMSDPEQSVFVTELRGHIADAFKGIRHLIRQIGQTDDEELLDFKTIMLISALAQPESVLRGCPFDIEALRNTETRQRFLRLMIDTLKK